MTQDELNLVLDALKFCHGGEPCGTAEAIAVVEKTLAQLEQEPVGQLLEDVFGRGQVMWFNKPKDESMLYTTPPQRTWAGLTDDEMEATFLECGGKWNGDFWKIEDADFHPFLRTIEAKLKDKNCVG